MFQDAIQEQDIFELTTTNNQYTQAMNSNPDFTLYDRSNKTAMQILNSPLPPPPQYPPLHPMAWSTPKLLHHPLPASNPPN